MECKNYPNCDTDFKAELAKLRAELDTALDERIACGKVAEQLRTENAELRKLVKRLQHYEAQIAALAFGDKQLLKDAERYRWLRKKKTTPCDYDTAIDAAMKEQT